MFGIQHLSRPPLLFQLICFFFCYLTAGRRRSSRLIASPWVFNWPKKPPVFVNLDEDQIGNSTPKVDAKNNSGRKKGSLGVISPPGVVGRLETSEDDDDFVTPLEKFSSSGSKRPARLEMGTGESRAMCTSIRGKKARLSRSLHKSPRVVCPVKFAF